MDVYNQIIESTQRLKGNLAKDVISPGAIVVILILLIGLLITLDQVYHIYRFLRIDRWPISRNAGKIVTATLETSTRTNTYSIVLVSQASTDSYYRPRVTFAYHYQGNDYISHTLSYNEPWTNNIAITNSELRSLPPGKIVDVYVNPNNPNEAYLYNKNYNDWFTLSLGIVLLIIGGLSLISYLG